MFFHISRHQVSISVCNPFLTSLSSSILSLSVSFLSLPQLILNDRTIPIITGSAGGVNVANSAHPCVESPCANGGSCRPKWDGYECDCPLGYDGRHCQKGQSHSCTVSIITIVYRTCCFSICFGSSLVCTLHTTTSAVIKWGQSNEVRRFAVHFFFLKVGYVILEKPARDR